MDEMLLNRTWIDRCYLPLIVGLARAVADEEDTRIAFTSGEQVVVARDLRSAVLDQVRRGELLCLRLRDGVAVTVDFVDGRPSLVSAQLAEACASGNADARKDRR